MPGQPSANHETDDSENDLEGHARRGRWFPPLRFQPFPSLDLLATLLVQFLDAVRGVRARGQVHIPRDTWLA